MFRIHIVKQLPKKPLLALAVLALAVMAGVGGAAKADAQTLEPRTYTIEVSFNSISFPRLDDCPVLFDRCDTADLSGEFQAKTSGGSIGTLVLSDPAFDCFAQWGELSRPGCYKHVLQGQTLSFAATPLCRVMSAFFIPCNAQYSGNNNKIRLSVRPGQTITVSVNLDDYDLVSDDSVCEAQQQIGPYPAGLSSTYQQTISLSQAFNGDGSCNVSVTLRRVS